MAELKVELDSATPRKTGRLTPLARWLLVTAPLSPLAGAVYYFSEWLFFITKPSPTAGLAVDAQLRVLVESPLPVLTPLLAAQAVATPLSVVAYPRFRGIACLPAGIILGFLWLVMLDNFTYTMFSVGLPRASEALRVGYGALLLVFITAACWKLCQLATKASRHTSIAVVSGTVTLVLTLAQAFSPVSARTRQLTPTGPDADVLPNLHRTGTAGSDRPNILFLGVDGVSAEMLSAYGYERPTTPFLDSIKDDTLFFENAFSNSTRTHGSLVTLLTGRLPFNTHVTFPPTVLQGDDAHRTLPVLLKELRYGTLQLGMRHYADAEDTNVFGFDAANYRWQEFGNDGDAQADETDTFRDGVRERIDERVNRLLGKPPAPDIFAHVEGRQVAAQWRDEMRVKTLVRYFKVAPQPWFIHLHLLDTHCCTWHPERNHFPGGPSATTDARDSQMRETDGRIRELFEGLEAAGILDKTIVVVNSDHGVEWKTTSRVPLMIRFPHAALKGRVTANVQAVDVAPTILDMLDVKQPEWMDGDSLLDPARLDPARRIFAVSDIRPRSGPRGLRLMAESGPPNYGASAVMMVAGSQWFELNLLTGQLTAGAVKGHTGQGFRPISEAAARREILDFLEPTGFRVEAQ